jgi:hypothetical protein
MPRCYSVFEVAGMAKNRTFTLAMDDEGRICCFAVVEARERVESDGYVNGRRLDKPYSKVREDS